MTDNDIKHSTRTLKLKTDNGWEETTWEHVTKGSKFRLWEEDGTIVRHANKYVFVALEDASEIEPGIWGVDIEVNE